MSDGLDAALEFTIAICTYNRAANLALVFADLERQEGVDRGDIEVLVVDNHSTDGTARLLAEWAERLPLRAVVELRQGTVYARNRAVDEAHGRVLLFLDDDVRLRAGWLGAYRKIFFDPGAVAVGGPIISAWPAKVPRWIDDTSAPPFPGVTVHYVPGTERRPIGIDGPYPFTANLGVLLSTARGLRFREGIGHIGTKAVGGEDADFCRRIVQQCGALVFDPSPVVDHPVSQLRMQIGATFGYLYRGAIAEAWYAPPEGAGRRIGPIPLWLLGVAARSLGSAAAGAVRADSHRAMVGAGNFVRAMGTIRGLLTTPAAFASRKQSTT